jgi:ferric-dicitrate binding protein FerR (iron transport regulator)
MGEAPGPALQANVDQYLGWTNQVFVFEETPLRDVLHQLELHFNVRITVSDSSSIDDPVTARYRNETLNEILTFTSITHGVEFEVESLNNNNN